MPQAITSKELRTDFPRIKRALGRGTAFVVYYRGKPIGDFLPHAPRARKPPTITWDDVMFHTKDKKPFDAAAYMRSERDERP